MAGRNYVPGLSEVAPGFAEPANWYDSASEVHNQAAVMGETKNWRRKIAWTLLIGVTVVWLCSVIAYGYQQCVFSMLEPNELGDFLTGALAPIGLVWVIVGVWYQRKEISTAIRELSQQSAAQEKHAQVSADTLQHYMDEAQRRRYIEWRSVQPTFVVGGSTMGSPVGLVTKVMVQENPISNVRISNYHPGKQGATVTRGITYIPAGGEFSINIGEPFSETLPFEWLVTYKDKLGFEAEQIVRVDENKAMSFYVLSEGPIVSSVGKSKGTSKVEGKSE